MDSANANVMGPSFAAAFEVSTYGHIWSWIIVLSSLNPPRKFRVNMSFSVSLLSMVRLKLLLLAYPSTDVTCKQTHIGQVLNGPLTNNLRGILRHSARDKCRGQCRYHLRLVTYDKTTHQEDISKPPWGPSETRRQWQRAAICAF